MIDPAALPAALCVEKQDVTLTATVAADKSADGEAHSDTLDVTVPAIGSHDYSVLVEKVAATCKDGGYEIYQCSRCDATKIMNGTGVDASNHAWGEWALTKTPTCAKKGVETRICGRCGEKENRKVKAIGHNWGKWTVVKPATDTEEGREQRVCSRCGEVEERVILVGGHSESKPDSGLNHNFPKRLIDFFCRNIRMITSSFGKIEC